MKCPTCGFDSPPEMQFCGQCGQRLPLACPSCGFGNPAGYRFCGMCGSSLTAAPPPAVPPQETKPRPEAAAPVTSESPPPAAPAAPPAVAPLVGERRIATILLADVYRSTDLVEQLGTEAWVEMMNQALQLLAAEVYRFGGRVDQFRGDGLIAFFGATDAHEDDPERAILAGLAMHEALRPCADEMQRLHGIDLKVRVGVNTGEVIAGSVGEAGRHREDTAMGGGVALAARMETAAEPGTVLVSAHTYRLIEASFKWLPLGEITVKGFSKPIAVYRPQRPSALAETRPAYDLELPTVSGHGPAFETLHGCVEALQDGRGGIVLLTGEKGMGKTALVSQARQLFALPHITWLLGYSRSYDQSTPYANWIGLLRNWLEAPAVQTESDPAARLDRQAGLLWGDQADRYTPYLAMLLALPAEGPSARRMAHLDAEGLRRQISEVLYSWVEALAQRGPTVLTFGDLQFADASSLEFLKTCLPICESAPVLWLVSFRPDRTSPAWEFRHHVETEYPHRLTSIDLPPLTAGESRALLDQMLGRGALADAPAALVVEKAEGNPYYLREIVYGLIEQGLLQRDPEDGWRQTRPIQSFNLPGSLRGLLLARIDRLSAEERRVLQIAAVIGPVFWRGVLEPIVGDASQLKSCLTQLQRSQLIHEQSREPDLGLGYVFTPSLVRDVAYDSLLSAQRIAYHRRVTDQLEALCGPESSAPRHGLLIYHCRQAGDLKGELRHTLPAAAAARKIYANADALTHYACALALVDQIESKPSDEDGRRDIRRARFEALTGQQELHELTGNLEAARADAAALLLLARQMADEPGLMAEALLHQFEVHSPTREEMEAGLKMAREAVALAQQSGEKVREMYALVYLGQLQYRLRDPSWQERMDRALECARQLGDLRAQVGLLLTTANWYGMDNVERSSEYLQAAQNISLRLEDKGDEAFVLYSLSPMVERQGDYHRQLTEFGQKRAALLREVGDYWEEANALMFCGQIQAIYLGDYEGGLAPMQESLERQGKFPWRLFSLLRIAQIRTSLGQFDAAWAALELARPLAELVMWEGGPAAVRVVEAIVHNAQGSDAAMRGVAASLHWREVLRLQAEVDQMTSSGHLRQLQMAAACEATAAHLGLAQSAEDAAERDEHLRLALEASQTALNIYREFGFTQVVECVAEEIMYRRSLALAANGRDDEAQELLADAYNEMMRKHDLIPADSPFRKTFLENIALHRQIVAAYEAQR